MKSTAEPVGLTPEYVMDLGRRAWFESIMNSLPDEELFKIRRTVEIEQKSEQKGEIKMLLRQLTRRFGELPAAVQERVTLADSKTLEHWSDLVLDARSLDEVFGPELPGLH